MLVCKWCKVWLVLYHTSLLPVALASVGNAILVGYYRKFVPQFADISRVFTHFTKKDIEFVVILTKIEFTFFRMAFLFKEISDNDIFCVKEHTATIIVNGLFNRLQRCVKALWQQFTSCHFSSISNVPSGIWAILTYSILHFKSYFSQFIFYLTLYKYW